MVYLQIVAGAHWDIIFADCSNAFCQGDKLNRKKGKLYASACEGLGLDSRQVIELVVPVYGLGDAPVRWRRTICLFLYEQGWRPSFLEPCMWVLRNSKTSTSADGKSFHELMGIILIEVDDLLLAGGGVVFDTFLKALFARFEFGKWEKRSAEFNGR